MTDVECISENNLLIVPDHKDVHPIGKCSCIECIILIAGTNLKVILQDDLSGHVHHFD